MLSWVRYKWVEVLCLWAWTYPRNVRFWVLTYWKRPPTLGFCYFITSCLEIWGTMEKLKSSILTFIVSTLGNLVFLSGQSMISPSFGSYILHISLRDTEALMMSFSPTEENLCTLRAWTQVLAGKWRRNLLLDLKWLNQVQRDIAVVSTVIAATSFVISQELRPQTTQLFFWVRTKSHLIFQFLCFWHLYDIFWAFCSLLTALL